VRVLIVGGSSYLGRSLCRKLADVCQVWGSFFRNNLAFAGTRVHLDVSDRNEAADLLRRIEPDVIFYLACDFNDIEGSIVIGTGNLLEARMRFSMANPGHMRKAIFPGLSGHTVWPSERPKLRCLPQGVR